MAVTISDWIRTGRDYKEGIELLRLNGASQSLLILLSQGENRFTRNKLESEIEKLQSHSSSVEEKQAESLPKPPSNFTESPEEINRLIDERQKLYRANDFIWSNITLEMDEEQRGIACLRILSNRKRIKEIYSKLDYYNTFNELPSIGEEKKDKSLFDLQKALHNARANRSKNKQRGKPDKVDFYNSKVKQIESEIENLTK